MQYFISTYAVSSESAAAYIFKKPSLYIRLHCIVYLEVMHACKLCYVIDRLSEQVHVVEVERSSNLVESLYGIDIQHVV